MNRHLLISISALALFGSACTLGGSSNNSGNVVQNTKPISTDTPTFSVPPAPSSTSAANTSSKNVISITDGNYDEVIRSQNVALILFWAPWSAPDRMMIPVIEALANEYSGSVTTGKVNVDENPDLSRKFGIRAIPTMVVIKEGTERERTVGVSSKKSISELLDKHLGRNHNGLSHHPKGANLWHTVRYVSYRRNRNKMFQL